MSTPRPLGSRYELLDLLGTGAMGEVWRARDRESEQELAAKVLRSEYARDTEIVTRFIQERSILTDLRHPNIVAVHDLVVEGDRLGILMELVEGGDLRGRLKAAGTLSPREAVTATCAVLDGLAEAHRQGCLHRDVKPDNVLLAGPVDEPGAVKLSDFSIARLAQESTVMATGLLGTPGYMPPELFVHGQFSAASDVYAAGVLLYELLAGRTPFAGSGTAHTIGNRHVSAEPPRIPVDDALWHVVATMLAKDPRVRLTAVATAAALRDLPDEVLDRPALAVQQHPEDFGPALQTALRPSPIRVQGPPSELDPGATNLHAGRQAPATPVAGQGEVVAFAPAAPLSEEELTSVGRSAPTHHAPVLTPGAVAEEPKQRKRWLPWAVAGLVVVLLGGGGIAFAQTRDDSGATGEEAQSPVAQGVSTIPATGDTEEWATGLEVERAVEYDPATQQASLTVSYTAGETPVKGPFYEVVPAVDDETECPAVVWDGVQQPANVDRSTGIFNPCSYAVGKGGLAAERTVDFRATVDIDLGDDPSAVEAWLDRMQEQTRTDLEATGVTSGVYAAQRLSAVDVRVESGLTSASTTARVVLLPVWLDGEVDVTKPLYNSEVGATTGLLNEVAGGLSGLSIRENCGGALSVDNNQVTVVRGTSGECSLDVEVGEIDAESGPIVVSLLGG